MKKILKVVFVICFIICLSGCGKEDKKSVLEKVYKKVNNTNGYKLEAEMELINNEDSYNYDISVSYKKKDNYRVSLRNKTNNHEQIILKNEDGVYVLTPTLNKSFKFQSKWPYNNSQSYLLKSVVDDLKSDDNISMKKTSEGYVFKSKVNYKNNENLSYQEVLVGKDYLIKEVTVLTDDDVVGIKVKFKSIDMKAKFDDDYFELEENIQTMTESDEINFEVMKFDEAIYPMYLPDGTYLETEKTVELEVGERIILTFAGEKPFMLVEEPAVKEDEMIVIPTAGELDIFMDTIAIVSDTSISWISGGVEYYLVSSDMTQSELLTVAKSIATMPVGK